MNRAENASHSKSRRTLLAAVACLAMSAAPAAWAQQYARIVSFRVDGGYMSQRGPVIVFKLVGTPDGVAIVRIPGTGEEVPLNESGPGIYHGEYPLEVGRRGVAGATAYLHASGQDAQRSLGMSLETAARPFFGPQPPYAVVPVVPAAPPRAIPLPVQPTAPAPGTRSRGFRRDQ